MDTSLFILTLLWPLLIVVGILVGYVIITTILVYRSAKKLQRAGVNVWAPGNWAGVVLLFSIPPIALLLYIIFYFAKYKPQLKNIEQGNNQQQMN